MSKIKHLGEPVSVCKQIELTLYEWEKEAEIKKREAYLMVDPSAAKVAGQTLEDACIELRKLLEGETKIRGGL